MHDNVDDKYYDKGYREAGYGRRTEPHNSIITGEGYHLRVGDDQRTAPQYVLHTEGRYERMRQVQTGKKHTVDPADQGATNDGNNQQQNRIVHALVNQHTCKAGSERCVRTYGQVDAGSDQAEQHTGGYQCIKRGLLENRHHVGILKEVRRSDRQNYTKDYQCAKSTSIRHQTAGFLRFSHLIYLPKLPS